MQHLLENNTNKSNCLFHTEINVNNNVIQQKFKKCNLNKVHAICIQTISIYYEFKI